MWFVLLETSIVICVIIVFYSCDDDLAKEEEMEVLKLVKEKNKKLILLMRCGSCDAAPVIQSVMKDVSNQKMEVLLDRIFSNTVNLSSSAIIHFFKSLCRVSLDEVGLDITDSPTAKTSLLSGPPRMFMLQRIVQITHYNMHRIRYEWSQIWRILQPHFNAVSCHENIKVATFAVDSLRQLGMKMLEREELSHFSTQYEFLKSFEHIIKHAKYYSIRELILNSLSQMISSKSVNIRSGWKSVFYVLRKSIVYNNDLERRSSSVSLACASCSPKTSSFRNSSNRGFPSAKVNARSRKSPGIF